MSSTGAYNPDEWEEKFDKKKDKKYWKNKVTGKATYNDPSRESKKEGADAETVASSSAPASGPVYNPDEWEEKFDKKKEKKYWKNKVTGKATYNDPSKDVAQAPDAASAASAPAPAGSSYNPDEWEEKFDKKKEKKYWKNKVTGKATYNDPSTEARKGEADAETVATTSAPVAGSTYNPDEWEEKFDKKKEKKYWKNKATGKATYNDPSKEAAKASDAVSVVSAPAPAESAYNPDEWEEKFDKKKEKKYWKNKATGKATYNDPAKASKGASDGASVTSAPAPTAAPAESSYNPDEWEEKFDKKKEKKYWKNKVTGKATYNDPAKEAKKTSDGASVASAPASNTAATAAATAALAELWEEKLDKKKGKKYWKNKQTGEATYKNPFEAATAAVAAVASGAKKGSDEVSVMSGTSTVATAAREASASSASEWVEGYSEKYQRPSWKNSVTGKTTYTKPAGWTAPSAASGSAAGVAQGAGSVRAIARVAFTTAADEGDLECPLHRAPERCLLQLSGTQQTTEIAVLRFQQTFVRARRARLIGNSTGDADINAAELSVEQATEVEQTFKLADLRSLICNEVRLIFCWLRCCQSRSAHLQHGILCSFLQVQGVVTIVLPPGGLLEPAAVGGQSGPVPMVLPGAAEPTAVFAGVPTDAAAEGHPAASVVPSVAQEEGGDGTAQPSSPPLYASIALHFGSPAMAQAWYALLVKRLALTETVAALPTAAAAPAPTVPPSSTAPLVLNKTGVEVAALSGMQDALLGTHSLACADPALMALETEWLCPGASAEDANLRQSATTAAVKHSSTEIAPTDLSVLPASGLLLFKVLAVHEYPQESAIATAAVSPVPTPTLDSTTSQMKGWMSCYVRLDRAAKTITFYDQGPGSAPSLAVSCDGAVLHVPDLTDSAFGYECNLYHCAVRNSPVHAKMSVAIKLPNATELYKWAISLSGLLETVTYCAGGVVQPATVPIELLQDSQYPSPPTRVVDSSRFPASQANLAETCLGVLETLAERKLCASYLRYVEVNGAQLKTARFLQINQRIVLLIKGACSALTEGSVLLSANGVNALTTPASTVLKFIADFPRQMKGELTVLKFPRMEFHVQMVKLTPPASNNEGDAKKSDPTLLKPNALSEEGAVLDDTRPLDSKGKLNKVIIQKRNSILKISSGMDMSYEGIAHPGIIADLQKELKALDVSATPAATTAAPEAQQGFTLVDFVRAPLTEVRWQKVRLMVASGNISILGTDEAGIEVTVSRLQLSSCQLKLVCPDQAAALTHVCVHLRDQRTHVVVRCATLAMFVDLVECLLIATKMMGAYAADLTHLYDQAVQWRNATTTAQGAVGSTGGGDKAQSLLMQTVLASAEESKEREIDRFSDTPTTPAKSTGADVLTLRTPRTGVPSTPKPTANEVSDVHILQAAEQLEAALSSLRLPANFPTHTMVEKELVELFKLNNANHRLLAEFLTLQFDTMNPVPETSVPASRQKSIVMTSTANAAALAEEGAQESKYLSQMGESPQHLPFQSDGAVAGSGDDRSEPAPGKEGEHALCDKLMAALGAGGPTEEDKATDAEREKGLVDRSQSADDADGAAQKASPSGSREHTPAPTARRASVQMRSGSVMVSSAAPLSAVQISANRRATFRKSAITHSQEQAAVLLMSQMEKQIMLQVRGSECFIDNFAWVGSHVPRKLH
jgi:hypothetical protein